MNIYLSFGEWLNKNPLSRWANHDFLIEIALYLKNKNKAKIIYDQRKLTYIKEFDYILPDCEIVLYDAKSDILKAYSFSEARTKLYDIFKKRNNKNDILVSTHLDHWGIDRASEFNIRAFSFQPYSPVTNYDFFYRLRQFIEPSSFIDKLFFRCTTGRGDELDLYKLDIVNDKFNPLQLDQYLYKAIYYKIGLSISNIVGICHRDIEYMAIGLPLMRVEYHGMYDPELIPNYHYISIDKAGLSNSSVEDLKGGPEFIKAYINKFEEVKNNYSLLSNISQNAKKYYDTNCHPSARLNNLLKILKVV